jgi:hypothetical protein
VREERLSECEYDDESDEYSYWSCDATGVPYYFTACDSSCASCGTSMVAGDEFMAYMAPACVYDDGDDDDDDDEEGACLCGAGVSFDADLEVWDDGRTCGGELAWACSGDLDDADQAGADYMASVCCGDGDDDDGCYDDEAALCSSSQGQMCGSCGDYADYCYDDSGVVEMGAPEGWFMQTCAATCGACDIWQNVYCMGGGLYIGSYTEDTCEYLAWEEDLSQCEYDEDDGEYSFWFCDDTGVPYYSLDCDVSCTSCGTTMVAGDEFMAYMAPACVYDDGDDDDDDDEGDYSAGSCYETTGHTISCNFAEEDCSEFWYEPGYVSSYSGCCHCAASCDHDAEWGTNCEDEYHDHYEEEEGACRCCEAAFEFGDPECEDGSAFFNELMGADADHTYVYAIDNSTQMCGSCSIPSMSYDECDAIMPDTAIYTSNYAQDWGGCDDGYDDDDGTCEAALADQECYEFCMGENGMSYSNSNGQEECACGSGKCCSDTNPGGCASY